MVSPWVLYCIRVFRVVVLAIKKVEVLGMEEEPHGLIHPMVFLIAQDQDPALSDLYMEDDFPSQELYIPDAAG